MADLTLPSALALTTSPNLTMSSREIAELTGKEHKNVLRDARVMLVELHGEGGLLSFEQTYRDAQNGQTYPMLALPKRETLILVSGYSVSMRAKIIDRWQELEQQVARPMSHLEVLVANAQALLEMDRRQQALMQAQERVAAEVARIESRVEQVAESRVWDHCPQNCEPITRIRGRMLKEYGLPAWVVDTVMRELPLSPKVHGMVRNGHEEAKGSHYEVWAVADVTRVFRRFVAECRMTSDCFANHPDVSQRFRIKPGVISAKAGA